jgi:hypothetical protein
MARVTYVGASRAVRALVMKGVYFAATHHIEANRLIPSSTHEISGLIGGKMEWRSFSLRFRRFLCKTPHAQQLSAGTSTAASLHAERFFAGTGILRHRR